MHEEKTYDVLLDRMLAAARAHDPNLDTREGSLVWYGSAPAAVEFQNLYISMDDTLNESYPDTASRPYLIRRAKGRCITPYPASPAVLELTVTPAGLALSEGARFSIGELNYAVTKAIGGGKYEITCETPGAAGNEAAGAVIPIEYIPGLTACAVSALLIPGEDEEDTEALRQRYFDSLEAQAFGGNRADYLDKVKAIPGVGGVRIYRAWNGGIRPAELIPPESAAAWLETLQNGPDIPAEVLSWLRAVYTAAAGRLLTAGGVVRLTIIDSAFSPPSPALLERVQTAIDPVQNAGEGFGLAPIGHVVLVAGVEAAALDLTFSMAFKSGWSWEDVQPAAAEAVEGYFLELAKGWANLAQTQPGQNAPLVVRVSQIESRLLELEGVLDVAGTRINGRATNFTLGADEIPSLGSLAPSGEPLREG